MPVTTFRNWQRTATLRERVVVYVIILLCILVAAALVQNWRLRNSIDTLNTQIEEVQTQVSDARTERNLELSDQRGIQCEILHKLGGYTPVCNLGAPPGDPLTNGTGTTTTVPTPETGTVPSTVP